MAAKRIDQGYQIAKERYAAMGIDTEAAIKKLATIPVSMHCWQGDDVGGFETVGAELSGGGIQVTGNYPGKARTADELRGDDASVQPERDEQHRPQPPDHVPHAPAQYPQVVEQENHTQGDEDEGPGKSAPSPIISFLLFHGYSPLTRLTSNANPPMIKMSGHNW